MVNAKPKSTVKADITFSFFSYVKVTHCILAVLSAICVPSVYIEHRNILKKKNVELKVSLPPCPLRFGGVTGDSGYVCGCNPVICGALHRECPWSDFNRKVKSSIGHWLGCLYDASTSKFSLGHNCHYCKPGEKNISIIITLR